MVGDGSGWAVTSGSFLSARIFAAINDPAMAINSGIILERLSVIDGDCNDLNCLSSGVSLVPSHPWGLEGGAGNSNCTAARIHDNTIDAGEQLKSLQLNSLTPPFFLPKDGVREEINDLLSNNEQLRALLTWAGRKFDLEDFADLIEVSWNSRLNTAFGKAAIGLNKIELSSKLWGFTTHTEKKEIVLHEACHLFMGELYGNSITRKELLGHGLLWIELMRGCGIQDPKFRMGIPDEARKRVYCRCSKNIVNVKIYNDIAKSRKVYVCDKCKTVARLFPYEEP